MTWHVVAAIGIYHLICVFSWRMERQDLLSRLMSRDWHDYNLSKQIHKTFEGTEKQESLSEGIRSEEQLAEDLAPISGFGMN